MNSTSVRKRDPYKSIHFAKKYTFCKFSQIDLKKSVILVQTAKIFQQLEASPPDTQKPPSAGSCAPRTPIVVLLQGYTLNSLFRYLLYQAWANELFKMKIHYFTLQSVQIRQTQYLLAFRFGFVQHLSTLFSLAATLLKWHLGSPVIELASSPLA